MGPAHVDLKDAFEIFACIGNPGFQGELFLRVGLASYLYVLVDFSFGSSSGLVVASASS